MIHRSVDLLALRRIIHMHLCLTCFTCLVRDASQCWMVDNLVFSSFSCLHAFNLTHFNHWAILFYKNIKQWQLNVCRKYTWPAAGEKTEPGCHGDVPSAEWQNFSCETCRLTGPQVPEKHCVTTVSWTSQDFKTASYEEWLFTGLWQLYRFMLFCIIFSPV